MRYWLGYIENLPFAQRVNLSKTLIGSSIGIVRLGQWGLVEIDMIFAKSPKASFCCCN